MGNKVIVNDANRVLSTLSEVIGSYELNEIIEWAVRFCFRNPYGGLTIVDKDGRIQFMDSPTEEFFGLKQGEARGLDVRELIPDSNLALTAQTGKPIIGGILQLKGIKRISSVYPLIKNGEIIGAVGTIVFHSLEEIERINGEIQRLKKEIRYLKQKERTEYSSLYTFSNILGNSGLIKETIKTAKKIAPLDTDVLIVGESGTGKELLAHSIHSFVHPDKPFIKVNCPAIPFELAESQLFGYEKGAFTGATAVGKAGVFEAAEGGTVFLDEISSLPLSIQAKLLRVLQEREVMRLGSTKTKKINFRSIAATNVNIYDILDNKLTFVSATGGGIYTAGTRRIDWNIASIAPYGGSGSVSFQANVSTNVIKGQQIIPNIYAADKAARGFVKDNPTLDAFNLVNAVTTLVATFKGTVASLGATGG